MWQGPGIWGIAGKARGMLEIVKISTAGMVAAESQMGIVSVG